MTHSLYYANSGQFSEEISFLADNAKPPLRWLCIDASAIDDGDYSAAETLRSVHARLKARGIRPSVGEVMQDVKTNTRYQLRDQFGAGAFYDRLEDVVRQYRQRFDIAAPPKPSEPAPEGVAQDDRTQ